MKIYFSFSISQSTPEIKQSVIKIVDSITNLGHTIVPEGIENKDSNYYKSQDDKEAKLAQKAITKLKKNADIVVLEVSGQSLGIGQELAFTLSINKPVIVLYRDDMEPHILRDEGGDSLILAPYNDEDLLTVLEDAIEYAASQQDVRFNFFISPAIGNYLDWISKVKKIPRSVFLRGLIEKDMDSNDEYSS